MDLESESVNMLSELVALAQEELNNCEHLNENPPANISSTSKVKHLKSIDFLSESSSIKINNNDIDKKGGESIANLFGLSDDEDDSKNINANEYERDIQHLLKKNEGDNKSSFSNLSFKASSSWKSPISSTSTKLSNNDCTDFFGIRVVKPLISSTVVNSRMADKTTVQISRLQISLLKATQKSNWVIAGVIVNKGPVKTSQNGKQFMVWTLSDLSDNLDTVSVFLFGNAFHNLWKNSVGTVIAILNPDIMENSVQSKHKATFKVILSESVLILGQSKDYGTCKFKKVNGDMCSSFVNINKSEFCLYHIKQAYQSHCLRPDLKYSSRGLTALRNKVLGKNEVFYAGKSYTAQPLKNNSKIIAKDKFILQKLVDNSGGKATNASPSNNPVTCQQNLLKENDKKEKDVKLLQKLGVNKEPQYIDLNIDFKKEKNLKSVNNSGFLLGGKFGSNRFDKAKLKAVSFVRQNGPLKKIDPNSGKSINEKKRPLDSIVIVCRKFNQICSQTLTRGFYQMERKHSAIYKKLKILLPRRESERRNHPLARHCDILSAVETRISMLNMTFVKYMENNICCFIPGKILDELERILKVIENTCTAPRTHEFLQELRDISSMAMEHFDEQILPSLKTQMDNSQVLPVVGEPSSSRQPLLIVNKLVTDEMRKIRKQNKCNKQITVMMQQQIVKLFQKIKSQNSRIKAQTNKLKEQEKKIQEQAAKLVETEQVMGEIKRHMEEWEQKFSDLTTELVRTREDLVSKNRLSPVPPTGLEGSIPKTPVVRTIGRILPRNSLPRTSTLFLRNFDRKRKSPECSEIPNKLPKTISKDICNKINKNITNNISKNITDHMNKSKEKNSVPENRKEQKPFSFLSSSIENLLKKQLNVVGRKRKMIGDIELKSDQIV